MDEEEAGNLPLAIQLPRLGNFDRASWVVIRCECWRDHVPFLRVRHWRRLAAEVDHG